MNEVITGLRDRVTSHEQIKLYLESKLVEFELGSLQYTGDLMYSTPPEPDEFICYILRNISHKFWTEVLVETLHEIAINNKCVLKFRNSPQPRPSNVHDEIVLYVVNK